jgi:hypothetical protein
VLFFLSAISLTYELHCRQLEIFHRDICLVITYDKKGSDQLPAKLNQVEGEILWPEFHKRINSISNTGKNASSVEGIYYRPSSQKG